MGISRRLPEWPDEGTDGAIRDVPEERSVTPLGFVPQVARGIGSSSPAPGSGRDGLSTPSFIAEGGTPKTYKDLDDFYADAESEEGSSEEEEEEEEEIEVGPVRETATGTGTVTGATRAISPLPPTQSLQDDDDEEEDEDEEEEEEEEESDDADDRTRLYRG